MALNRLSPWLYKPPAGVEVDWSHPLAQFLRGFWLLNEEGGTAAANLAYPGLNNGSLTNSPTWAQTAAGSGITFAGTNQNVNVGRGSLLDNLSDQTFEALIYYGGTTGSSQRIVAKMNSSFYNGLMLTSGGNVEYQRDRATLENYYLTTAALTSGELYHLIGTHEFVSGATQVYINGVSTPASSSDVGSGALVDDSGVDLFLGNRSDNARPFKGTIIYARVWSMYTTPDIAEELYVNPYGIVAPRSPMYFVGWPEQSTVDKSGSDSATLADSSALAAASSVTDSATESESSSIAASASVTDSATASESSSIAAGVSATDAASLAEATSLLASSGVTDASTLAESSAIAATPATTDAGTLGESSAIAASASASDAGTLADSSTLAAASNVTDAGTLDESASLVVDVSASDAATLGESSSVSTGSNPTSSDAGELGESASISASVAATDAIALGEAGAIDATLGISDAASASESAAIDAGASATDAATLADTSALAIAAQVADAAALAEAAELFAQLAGVDGATLSESATVEVIGVIDVTAFDGATLGESAVLEIIAATHPAPPLGTIGGRGGANVGGRAGSITGTRSSVRNIARRRS